MCKNEKKRKGRSKKKALVIGKESAEGRGERERWKVKM